MSERNVSSADDGFTLAGRTVDAGRPVEWLKRGWEAFLKNPGVWIACTVIAGLCLVVPTLLIPLLGQLVANVLFVVFAAGLMLGCQSLAADGELRVDHLIAGFSRNGNGLLALGVLFAVVMLAATAIPFVFIGGAGTVSGITMGNLAGLGVALGSLMLAFLVSLALTVPLTMAIWFAPALVVFHNVAPLAAMKSSFNACLKNLVPFLVYGVILLVLFVVAAIPAGLGFLVLFPVLIGAQYASYVEIYE